MTPAQPTTKADDAIAADTATLIAIAVIAYIVQNVLHEGVGHGLACLAVGGKAVALSTAYFDWESQGVGDAARRFVAAAGASVNLAAGLIFWGWLVFTRSKSSHLRFFLWLSMTVNLLSATGYLLFSGMLGVGDGVVVIEGLSPAWAWRVGLVVAGLITYMLVVWLALRVMNGLLGDKEPGRVSLAFKLSLVSYLAGSFTSTLGSLLNPISMVLVATSAASSFGGTSALAWMTQLYKTKWFAPCPSPPVVISRNWGWIVAAGVLLFMHIVILGPSIKF